VKKLLLVVLIAVLLASCQPSAPTASYSKGDLLRTYDFTGSGSFEEGVYDAATLTILNGAYEINVTQGDNVLWWGQWGDTYTDTVIEVDIVQQSEPVENAYGVMCRVSGEVGQRSQVDPTLAAVMQDSTDEPTAEVTLEATSETTAEATAELTDEPAAEATSEATEAASAPLLTATPQPTMTAFSQGDGYLFLIQGSGSYAIMRARGRNLTPLVNWTTSDAIRRGPSQNRIRAVCVGNTLSLYVNDQFLATATDDTYSSGQVGLAASAANRLGTRIAFDNLSISEALPS
jgi:hypothetical protein